ncbi:sialidase family protein [uncultured Cyclobacterium sp.]|uniref:sialidase family protein n=1 Tax=uncultured Cyclobacterium sp. TaxID=453820 RepID=UPI0030EDB71B
MIAKKNYKPFFILAFVALCTFISCSEKQKLKIAENIVFEQVYIPVIQGETTTIAYLNFNMERDESLSQLEVDLGEGTTIENVSIALAGEDGGEEMISGEYNSNIHFWRLKEEIGLEKGEQQLAIKITLPEDADLKSKFSLNIPMIEVGGAQSIPKGLEDLMPYRPGTALRTANDDGVAAFRIPGLATSNSGTLLAVYDVRHEDSSDLQGDIDVGLSRSVDGGNTWEPMQIIMDMGEWGGLPQNQNGIGDPAILVDNETGAIYVVALWIHGKPGTAAWRSSEPGLSPEKTGQLMLVKSVDDGKTWSSPRNITQPMKKSSWQLFFNGPGKGIRMKNGTLVFAAQYKDREQIPHSTIIYSENHGETWQVGSGARPKTTEAQVVELEDGGLMLNMRDDRGGSRAVYTTGDMGKSWHEHPTNRSALIEPICMGSLIRFDRSRLLFSNPESTEGRFNMTIKMSNDDGLTWPDSQKILLDGQKGWGYSCMTKINDESIGILYESSQAHMTFQIVSITELNPNK